MAVANSPPPIDFAPPWERLGQISVMNFVGTTILFAAAFFNLVSLDADKSVVALDIQVLAKLAILGLGGAYGAYGFLTDLRVQRAALSFPAAWILLLFCLYMVSSIMSTEPQMAVASSISILCVYLLSLTACIQIGKERVMDVLFFASALFVVVSWMVYFVMPDLGVMNEALADGQFKSRMSGLAHPNTLGQFSAICAIIGLVQYWSDSRMGWLRLFLIALALGALLNCLSRSSLGAFLLALAVGYRHHFASRTLQRRFLLLVGLGVVALMLASTKYNFEAAVNERISGLSKSGDSEEIYSATGRGAIWAKTIELIQQKPLTGYGPASSKRLLEDYSLYTHNLFLNIALCAGVVGGLFALLMCGRRLQMMLFKRHPLADALVAFVLLNGLFENVIFSNLCGLPTIVWTVAVAWYQLDEARDEDE